MAKRKAENQLPTVTLAMDSDNALPMASASASSTAQVDSLGPTPVRALLDGEVVEGSNHQVQRRPDGTARLVWMDADGDVQESPELVSFRMRTFELTWG